MGLKNDKSTLIEISLIVPAYKRVRQTLRTIKLILSSYGLGDVFDLEIIVSDSSPGETLKRALKKEFSRRVIYTRPVQPGVACGKNQGAKRASAPILIFCDSDMEIEHRTILNTIAALKKHESAGMIGGQVTWRGGERDGQRDRPRHEDRRVQIEGTVYIEALYSRYVATYRQIFWHVGGYDEQVFNMRGEGSDLAIRYWRAGFPLVYDSSIRVYHVHNAPDSIAMHVDHPEWGIAKDLLLLTYKYDILDDHCLNFASTAAANFDKFGRYGYYKIIQGIAYHLDFIKTVKSKIDKEKHKLKKNLYDFKFLEIFSNQRLFKKCINEAPLTLAQVRRLSLKLR